MPSGKRQTPPQSARILDVARLAGVSVATVSRALVNPAIVSEETRNKVLGAVQLSGYAPNTAARNLRIRKSMMVLVVIPDIGNPFFSEVLKGIEDTLSAEGYGIIIADLAHSAEKESRYVELAMGGLVDGVLLLCGRVIGDGFRNLRASSIPLVAICEQILGETFPQVEIDNRQAARDAVEHLVGRGHQRIAYLSGPEENILNQERFKGYQDGLRAHTIALDPALIFSGNFSFASGRAAAQVILSRPKKNRPTAVFAANDEMAIGALKTCLEAGLTIPQDMALMGFDGISYADFYHPSLSTIVQPRAKLGATGARILLQSFSNRLDLSNNVVRLEHALKIGGST